MKVVILRSVSGGGKTTWRKKNYPNAIVCSADETFETVEGYKFDPTRLEEAHGRCLLDFVGELENNRLTPVHHTHTVVVDNTNSTVAEMAPYVALAQAYNVVTGDVELEIVRLDCPIATAIARNVHGVPEHAIRRMAANIEHERLPRHWPKETPVKSEAP